MRPISLRVPFVLAVLLVLATAIFSRAQDLLVTTDRTNGIYNTGDTVHWQIKWTGETSATPAAHYQVLKGGLKDIAHGDLNFAGGAAGLETKFDAPGTLLLEVKWRDAGSKDHRSLAGAVAAPDRIKLSAPRPADFDAFWDAKLKELAAVPVNPKLESVDLGNPKVAYWKITMDNIRGTHIQGQLARPAQGDKFPAILIVQWAGVYALPQMLVTNSAGYGWLALDIEAHDLPIDRPEAFYKEQADGPLKDYPSIGNDDRDTSYFLRMYLSCCRAVDYLASRPDWNGRTLVVMGGSQGGLQTLMTAGLHPKNITAALAEVPAGCDMLGPDADRRPGWPQWYYSTGGKDPKKVREASRYYDVANFTPHITCPVLVGFGLIDETCPPGGVLAAVNQITSPKEVIIMPQAAHQEEHGSHGAYSHRAYNAWLSALWQGNPPPVNQ